jgi:hypothetical protein
MTMERKPIRASSALLRYPAYPWYRRMALDWAILDEEPVASVVSETLRPSRTTRGARVVPRVARESYHAWRERRPWLEATTTPQRFLPSTTPQQLLPSTTPQRLLAPLAPQEAPLAKSFYHATAALVPLYLPHPKGFYHAPADSCSSGASRSSSG